MPFGEYELSPSLIGLSLFRSPHPEAFQRLLVRSSIPCYRDFNLDMCRSLGFASTPTDYKRTNVRFVPSRDKRPIQARFHCGSGTPCPLTLPVTVTRRFIMQKARRHMLCMLRPLVGVWFQELFHSSRRGSFHLSLTVLDRKSTRLNSSHANISYAVFCLKKKKKIFPNCFVTILTN